MIVRLFLSNHQGVGEPYLADVDTVDGSITVRTHAINEACEESYEEKTMTPSTLNFCKVERVVIGMLPNHPAGDSTVDIRAIGA